MGPEKIQEYLREQRKKAEKSDLPLKSVRVIDLGAVVAAPFAATLLGDYGAEVIKVEPPDVPDAIRYWARVLDDREPFWLMASRNKLPITLNLKHPEGKKILARLVEKADVLFENMRPGTLDRLGFSAEELWRINRGLIIGRISGYGQTGPYREKPGFGTLAEAMSGYTYMNTHPGAPPTNPPMALADMIAGTHMALGAMIALRDQKRGEKGGKELEIALYEPLLGYMAGHFLMYSLTGKNPEPMGNESNFTAPRNSFQTKEGKWVALSASAQAPFERLIDLVGHPELKTAPGFRSSGTGSGPGPSRRFSRRAKKRASPSGRFTTWKGSPPTPMFKREAAWLRCMTRLPKGLSLFPGCRSGSAKTRGRSVFPGCPWARPTGWCWETCWVIPPEPSRN
jgi:crotonobetainyl-CoA:carnitine CoA-transferase CaiB-like acyl-CoA transferase